MGYSADSFSAGEQPTTSKWNKLWANDASFNDGTGIGNGVITANKLATGAAAATVATSEATTSTSYTDLATTTDSVTVTIGQNGLAFITLTSGIINNTASWYSLVSFVASGANTIAASDTQALVSLAAINNDERAMSWSKLLTGLTPGSTTFKMKYKVSGNSGTFKNRTISVIPL